MDLTSDHPFWFVKNGLLATYPPLGNDIDCEVAVVGAGITGAMIAQRLTREGHAVVVLDARDICTGSTAASTALLQYEIDVPLVDMAELIGREDAEQAYRISHASIDDIECLVEQVGADCDFRRKTSIYLATDRKSAKTLADEARARKQIGLDVTYHDEQSLREQFSLDGSAALSSGQAADCDPYKLAHALLRDATSRGCQVFDRTRIEKFDGAENQVRLTTDRGPIVTAKHCVLATGYESQELLRERVVNLENTYALVSQPLESLGAWSADWMLWEAKTPYLYLRITGQRRLLVGGEDDRFHSPTRRDACIHKKAARIEQKARELLPEFEWEPEFAWAGTFGKTKDGLAYIGATSEFPSCYFALGFGGNGITFSSIATNLIARMLRGDDVPEARLFRFGR